MATSFMRPEPPLLVSMGWPLASRNLMLRMAAKTWSGPRKVTLVWPSLASTSPRVTSRPAAPG